MPERILMIDDDEALAGMLSEYLAKNGLTLDLRFDATSGLAALAEHRYDALILDVMLPDMEGFEVCRRVRANSRIPIVMLTARGDELDRIVGLELGADDYLPKPFNPRELLARLRAVLRRSSGEARGEGVLRFGRLEIDCDTRSVRLDGHPCALTSYQFDLLRVLAESAGRVLSREALMQRAGRDLGDAFDRSIDVHVSRIRAAIEDDPKQPRRLLTVRGVGYVFAASQDGD
jgi:DNA-binding response OmpR family regulator